MSVLDHLRRLSSRLEFRLTALIATLLVIFAVELTAYATMVSRRAFEVEAERHAIETARLAADLLAADAKAGRLSNIGALLDRISTRRGISSARLLDRNLDVLAASPGSGSPGRGGDALVEAARRDRRIEIA